jgi:Tol biopolymer transport system component
MYDRQSKSYELVSVSQAAIGSLFLAGNNPSFSPAVSADGRFIVFLSSATDLIADPTLASNGFSNVYLRDRFTNTTTLESIGFNTNPAGDISLVAANGNSRDPAISADGEVISYSSNADNLVADDTNGAQDIFTSPIP